MTIALCLDDPYYQCFPVYEQCYKPPVQDVFYDGQIQNWTWDGIHDVHRIINDVCVPDSYNGLYVPPGNYTIADYWGLAEIEIYLPPGKHCNTGPGGTVCFNTPS
jgi:hypothetical protein